MKKSAMLSTTAMALMLGLAASPAAAQTHGSHSSTEAHDGMKTDTGGAKTHHGLFSHKDSKSVGTQLSEPSHQKLDSRLEKLLGVTNATELQADASGFKNLGQFVAAAHVYNNLGLAGKNVSWATFSASAQSKGLGKSIQTFAPQANSKEQIKHANSQAHDDIAAG